MFAKFLGEFISVRIHAAPASAPARIQEKNLANEKLYWFRTNFPPPDQMLKEQARLVAYSVVLYLTV